MHKTRGTEPPYPSSWDRKQTYDRTLDRQRHKVEILFARSRIGGVLQHAADRYAHIRIAKAILFRL